MIRTIAASFRNQTPQQPGPVLPFTHPIAANLSDTSSTGQSTSSAPSPANSQTPLRAVSLITAPPAPRAEPTAPVQATTTLAASANLGTLAVASTQGADVGLFGPRAKGWAAMAYKCSAAVGNPWAFGGATASVILWLAIGAPMRWNDTWQLIMNTAASIIAYMLIFLLQTTQNRDTRETHQALRILNDKLTETLQEVKELRIDNAALREELKSQAKP